MTSKKRIPRDQVTIDGLTQVEANKQAQLSQVEEKPVVCLFCFQLQSLRQAAQFDYTGDLLRMFRCVKCRRKMQKGTLTYLTTYDAKQVGIFVGYYPRFWFSVDHDRWLEDLKQFYSFDEIGQFWEGYGIARPEFAEKQRFNKLEREYEQQWQK